MNIKIYQNDLPNNFKLEGDIAVDTETMGLNIHRDKLCLLQFSNGNGAAHLVHFINQDYTAPNLKALLLDKTRCKIFHFARFDLASIKKYLSIDLENIFCTKISSKLVRTYTDSHGLKDLCRELLNINISKQQQSSYWGTDNLSLEQKEYAAKDVLYLHQLKDILQKMLFRENRLELAHEIFRFLPTRVNLDLIGWDQIDIFTH
ncbi:ribonuclease D [Rickettsia typhi]|uniref:Ribonuclease D n=2 Tax=Rickettsia typhi TaxID=785 RepID=Q68WV7_RICTY|nr:ribonuclease D [Rickettsia typhi]AAU03885.1 ribonuclease D [Rickettsia typhi str. Wilmington]AFE54267.1 ribonuclease D [Rickettsia typhi str. TH1527]AFE55107.1 ribonuclease D [Rickettsia typhi str. B9991CWPP]